MNPSSCLATLRWLASPTGGDATGQGSIYCRARFVIQAAEPVR